MDSETLPFQLINNSLLILRDGFYKQENVSFYFKNFIINALKSIIYRKKFFFCL